MRIKTLLFITFFVVLSLVYAWYETTRPKPTDWTESYSPKETIPYGTYIFSQSLPSLFPEATVISARIPVMEQLDSLKEYENTIYLFVNGRFAMDIDKVEQDLLLRFVEKGNTLFVVSQFIPDMLLSRFSLACKTNFSAQKSRLIHSEFPEKEYLFDQNRSNYFVLDSTFSGEVLGVSGPFRKPDFVKLRYGKGTIFLNLHPKAFTNYSLLDRVQGDYCNQALSFVPEQKKVIWDTYQVLGAEGSDSPFRVILRYPVLKWAFYLLLAGGLLYVLFKMKREQRPMTVIRPLENKLLEFVSVISSLYYKNGNHSAIANKRIDIFMEEVRWRYKLRTDVMDEYFVRLLADRAGMDLARAEQLVSLIVEVRKTEQVSPELLKRLVKQMEKIKE